MPQSIAGNPAGFPAAIRAPTDSDPANTSQLTIAFNDIADRTANLKSRVDGTSGVASLRRVVSDAALRALAPHSNADICLLDGVGFYEYIAASTVAPSAPWVRTPNDVTGAGRWLLLPWGAVGGANGLAQCDASGRVPAASMRNGLVGVGGAVSPGSAGTTLATIGSATDTDINGMAVNLPGALAGDFLLAVSAFVVGVVSGTVGRARLAVVDGANTATAQEIELNPVNSQVNVGYALCGLYAVQNGGTVTVKLRGARTSGTGSLVFANQASLFALLVRP